MHHDSQCGSPVVYHYPHKTITVVYISYKDANLSQHARACSKPWPAGLRSLLAVKGDITTSLGQ